MISKTTANMAARLMASTTLAGVALGLSPAAYGQNETITVTGTSIRGEAPVGANLITVDRTTIEKSAAQTVQQIMSNIPGVVGFGSPTQGGILANDPAGHQTPTIHYIGNSASNATLILVDGHRLPQGGINGTYADPSIIPAAVIQRVEVLPDGASAIYGSDAIAGVINFHTRKDFTGWESSVQFGVADHYNTFSFNQLFGHSWEGGSVLAAFEYGSRSALMNRDRDFITARQDLRFGSAPSSDFVGLPPTPTGLPAGQPYPSYANNFAGFNCAPATIATGSGTSAFYFPYNGTAVPTSGTNLPSFGTCDQVQQAAALPSEVKNQAFVAIRQSLNERLSVSLDATYSSRLGTSRTGRGTVSATVWGPTGSGPAFGTNQRNPFYVGNPTIGTASEFVRFDFEDLLGAGAATKTGSQTIFSTLGVDVDLGAGWAMTTTGVAGADTSFQRRSGTVNGAEAFLALNGTTNQNGTAATSAGTTVLPDPFNLGTVVAVTRALTTANALDVWNPRATNRTSDAVKRSLIDSANNLTVSQDMQDITIKFDGPLADIWAGPIKAAFGGEYRRSSLAARTTDNSIGGPASTSSRYIKLDLSRVAYSAFMEFLVPLVNEDMGIPGIRKLTLDLSGRYDRYNDFGSTKNPKASFSWDVIDGLKVGGSYGTSFVAPALTSIGAPGNGLTRELAINSGSGFGAFQTTITVPFNYRNLAGTFLENPTTCLSNGGTLGTVNTFAGVQQGCTFNTTTAGNFGISYAPGGNPNVGPETGLSYSLGTSFNMGAFWDVLEGFTGSVTYYQAKFKGVITSIGASYTTSLAQPGLQRLVRFAPPGGWDPSDPVIQATISGIPLNNPLPPKIWYIWDGRQQNMYNIWSNGLDIALDYRYETENLGTFTFGLAANEILRFSQTTYDPLGSTAPVVDIKSGLNGGRYLANELSGKLSLNWQFEPFSVGFSYNYLHPVHLLTNAFPYFYAAADGSRLGGYQHIGAVQTFDMNASYNLPSDWLQGAQIYARVNNLLNTSPPFANTANGFNAGDPTGRLITVGLRMQW